MVIIQPPWTWFIQDEDLVQIFIDEVRYGEDLWSAYFKDFKTPYGFYTSEEYTGLLQQAGLTANRVELIPKDMVHMGNVALAV